MALQEICREREKKTLRNINIAGTRTDKRNNKTKKFLSDRMIKIYKRNSHNRKMKNTTMMERVHWKMLL